MAKPKENGFIIETYDEEKDMRVQFNYLWKIFLFKYRT